MSGKFDPRSTILVSSAGRCAGMKIGAVVGQQNHSIKAESHRDPSCAASGRDLLETLSMNRPKVAALIAAVTIVAAVSAQDKKSATDRVDASPLAGEWEIVSNVYDGEARQYKKNFWHVRGNCIDFMTGSLGDLLVYKIDEAKTPREIDLFECEPSIGRLRPNPVPMLGIYKIENDTLTVCYNVLNGKERPKEFASEKNSRINLFVFKRTQLNISAAIELGNTIRRATVLRTEGKLQEAIQQYERAIPLAIRVNTDGSVSPNRRPKTAVILLHLSELYQATAEFDKAIDALLRGTKIVEEDVGKKHPEYAHMLGHLATLHLGQYDFVRAEPLLRQAFEIHGQSAEKHPDYVNLLVRSGRLYDAMGEYSKAQKFYQDSLPLMKSRVGENHSTYITILNSLAIVYSRQGDYARAEPLLRQACEKWKQRTGEKGESYATGLTSLARLYREQGDNDRAEPLIRQALEIRRFVNPRPITDDKSLMNQRQATVLKFNNTADCLNDLARLYHDQGNYARAGELYQEALETRKQVLTDDDPNVADSLDNLAVLYRDQGDYASAEPLVQQALGIRKTVLGEQHPHYADSVINLARLFQEQGDYRRAEPLIRQALDIRKRVLGEKNPLYAEALEALASLHQATGRPEDALRLAVQAMQARQAVLENVFAFSSETTMRAYLESVRGSVAVFLSHCSNQQGVEASTALTWTLRRKGILLDALCRFRQSEHEVSSNPVLAPIAMRWRYLRQQLADLPLKGGKPDDPQRVEKQIKSWQEEADRLESDLHRALSEQQGAAGEDVDVAKVQGQMQKNACLVEFVRVPVFDFKATGAQPRWKPARYFAFVLTAGKDASPHLIDLGLAEPIDQAVQKLRQEIEAAPRKLRLSSEKDVEAEFRAASKVLYKDVFAPLRVALGQSAVVYLAPDGELNRVAFEALVDEKDHYLIEGYRFVYLSCGRDLLRVKSKSSSGTVVFAGPDFDLNAKQRQSQIAGLPQKGDQVALRGPTTTDLRGLRWSPLPGAAAEAADIEGTLKSGPYGPVQVYSGSQALEDAFKRQKAPRVLHLATHGFFLEDVQPSSAETGKAISGGDRGQDRLRMAKNPLLRSGIVLAGANALGEEASIGDLDDGWVTAEEIALMNLRGTDLVVLSACESGLGDVKTGEGVFGLRRAFLYAGAQTLVTSLFKVPDDETRQMMQRFYGSLGAGKGKLEALHEAQLEMIQRRRQEHGASHPFFWASFVLAGDPGFPTQVLARSESPNESAVPTPATTQPDNNKWMWAMAGLSLFLVTAAVILIRRSLVRTSA